MDLDKVASQLNDISKTKYYKFVYKGNGSCKICSRYNGKVFSEQNLPETHPNCRCAEETDDPVDIALGKFPPPGEYDIGSKNFNDSRRKLEEEYGGQINSESHSAPQLRLGNNIKRDGYNTALYRHIAFREGKYSSLYFDSNNIPSIGVGTNLKEEYIIKELLRIKAISPETATRLRAYRPTNDRQKQDELRQHMSYVKLTENQMRHLFDISLKVAREDARQVFSTGKWVKEKDKDGNVVMKWNDYEIDNDTWGEMPDQVKAICVDLSFNLGSTRMAKYKNFIKAVKAKDYRRAALELLDSRDFYGNIKKGLMNGIAKRRLDAAIELSELAEEQLTR